MEKKFNAIYILLSILVVVILAQSYYLYDFKQQRQNDSSLTNKFFNNFNSNSSDPFEKMQKMQEEMQKSFGKFNSIFSNDPFYKDVFSHMSIAPLSDFKESKNEYILELDIPGAQEKKITIDTKDNVLKVKASIQKINDTNGTNYFHKERFTQSFMRSFTLPNDAKMDALDSSYKNGILKITIPKRK
jgi:HSP20 family protein